MKGKTYLGSMRILPDSVKDSAQAQRAIERQHRLAIAVGYKPVLIVPETGPMWFYFTL